MPHPPWPATIDRVLGAAAAEGDPVRQAAGGQVARWVIGPLGPLVVANFERDGEAAAHVARLEALAEVSPFAVARVVERDGPWLVTERPPGLPADQPDRHPEPGSLATAVGRALSAIHGLPTDAAVGADQHPADGWAPVVERCRRLVATGSVEVEALPAPYDRYGADRLVELLEESVATLLAGDRSVPDPPVLCHGSATPSRVLVDGSELTGIDGFESALVADRHLDLATAHLWVAELLGAEAVFGLYDGYGCDPHLGRLDAAVLAAHLLGLGPIAKRPAAPPPTPPGR